PIQVRDLPQAEEELGSSGVRVLGAGHGEDSRKVRAVIELRLDRIARASGPVPVRAATLDHEAFDDPMKDQAIIETRLRKSQDIEAVTGRHVRPQVETNRSSRGLQVNLVTKLLEIDLVLLRL